MQILVLGAGYAGLAAAKLAARWTNAEVTLVNATDRFVERVRLHQLAAGQQLPDLPLAKLLDGSGVQLVVDRVTGIDPVSHTVRVTGSDQPLSYDRLIYALGSQADLGAIPSASEHVYPLATEDDAVRLRSRLPEAEIVTVVGGGLTGIEAATEIAEAYPQLKVRLITEGGLGEKLSQRAQRYLRQVFHHLGIEIRENASVTETRPDGLVLRDGQHMSSDTIVWTTGFRVPPLAREAGFAVDTSGKILVDETLRSTSHPDVSAIGDAAAMRHPNGQELRMACAVSGPAAQKAVRALADRLAGRTPSPFRFRYYNQCISLGRRNGLIQFVHGDDTPLKTVLTGRAGALYKEAIVRSTIWFLKHPSVPVTR